MPSLRPTTSSLVHEPQRRLGLREAAADQPLAAPAQPETRPETRKIHEKPANADVAQLVEHFTRNEGVPGSSPGVGSGQVPVFAPFRPDGLAYSVRLLPYGSAVESESEAPPPSRRAQALDVTG
jgi:hypothetical protein